MNERIRELAEQCRGNPMISEFEPRFDREKFAELIVRECIDRAERYGLGSDAVEQMKEDFGVEE
jgi:hypothetical protein